MLRYDFWHYLIPEEEVIPGETERRKELEVIWVTTQMPKCPDIVLNI